MLFVTCPTLMDINLSDFRLITDSVLDRERERKRERERERET